MKSIRRIGLLALGLAVFSGNQAGAETSVENLSSSVWERAQLTVFSWVNGPAFTNPQPVRPWANFDKVDHVTLTNQITFAVPLFANIQLEVMNTVDMSPFGQTSTAITEAGSPTPLFVYQDPSVGLQGVAFNSGRATLWGRWEVAMPVSDGSRKAGQVVAPRMINVFEYQPKGSGWIMRALLAGELDYFSDAQSKLSFWASPQLFYEFDQHWRAISLYGLGVARNKGTNYFAEDPPTNNLGLGFRYTFKGGHYIQPYANLYPFGRVLETAHVAAIFFAQLK